jgi:hypothetical protein
MTNVGWVLAKGWKATMVSNQFSLSRLSSITLGDTLIWDSPYWFSIKWEPTPWQLASLEKNQNFDTLAQYWKVTWSNFIGLKKKNLRFEVALSNSCLCGNFFYMNINHFHFSRWFTFFMSLICYCLFGVIIYLVNLSECKRILCFFFFSLFASL